MSQGTLVLPTSGTYGGAAIAALINTALAAIASQNSGNTDPGAIGAYALWADTGNSLLKMRSADNTAWVTICPLLAALAALAGNATQTFSVGTATAAAHAVPLSQVQSLIAATTPSATPAVRQTVQAAAVNAAGQANYITTGAGLAPLMQATAVAVLMAFAQGTSDYIEKISADVSWPAVPANNLSFLYSTRTAPGTVALGSTLAPPQYGPAYNQVAQSKVDLNNTALDDFGPAWTNTGVTFSNTSPMLTGTYMGVFNGASYIHTNAFSSLYPTGNGGFTWRGIFKFTGVASLQTVLNATNGSGIGAQVGCNASGKVAVWLSSTGSTNDIANGTAGTTTLVAGTGYLIEITQDQIAGKYYVWVGQPGGAMTLDQAITSTAKVAGGLSYWAIGAQYESGTTNQYFTGSAQGIEFFPYCLHPAGTSWTAPTALSTVATAGYTGDWIDTSAGITVRQVSGPSTVAGTNPTFTSVNRVYNGEATAGASSISGVVSYALNGRYVSPEAVCAASTTFNVNHNIGVDNKFVMGCAFLKSVAPAAAMGTPPGSIIPITGAITGSNASVGRGAAFRLTSRNAATLITGTSLDMDVSDTGNSFASFNYYFYLWRDF